MGRSVSYPTNAIVAYSTFETSCDWDAQSDWEDLVSDFQDRASEMWPSLTPCTKWLGREDHAVLSNRHAYMGISEYCGVVAFWVVSDGDAGSDGLSSRWVASIADRFQAAFGTINRLGTFSNGEGVFERIAA